MKWTSIGLVLCSVLVGAAPAAAQGTDELFEVVGRYDSGIAHDVEAVGDVLFYAVGSYVVALGVSDPQHPAEIMRRQFGASTGDDLESYPAIAVVDSLAYVGVGKRLHVLDARNPADLREIGSTELSVEITDLHVSGGLVYALSFWWGVAIVDVSDPRSPRETAVLGARDLDWNVQPGIAKEPPTYHAVTTIDSLALLATSDWVHVLDVSDPSAPVDIGHIGERWANDLSLREDILFTLGSTLKAYDVSDPLVPVLIGELDLDEHPFAMAIRGPYVYVPTVTGQIEVIDAGDPAEMSVADSLMLRGRMVELSHSGDVLYAAAWYGGVHMVDISTPAAPARLATVETGDRIRQVAARGEAAYMAALADGLVILDMADPAHPVRMAGLQVGEWVVHVAFEDELVFAAGGDAVYLFDASDPLRLEPLGVADPFYGVTEFTVQDSVLYVSAHSDFYIYDIADPTDPRELEAEGFCPVSESCVREVDVEGNLAVLGGTGGELRFVDVSDPRNPVKMDRYAMPGDVFELRLRGELAFVTVGGTLYVLDVSNTAAPVELTSLDLGVEEARTLTFDGDYVYVSARDDGIVLVDVSDPSAPQILGRSELARNVSVVDGEGRVYGTASTGLVVFAAPDAGTAVENDVAREDVAVSVYPNPASGDVTFRTEGDGPLRVEVFDLTGRRIRVLEGSGSLVWDGRDASGVAVPPGVYLCRIRAGAAVVGQAVVMGR